MIHLIKPKREKQFNIIFINLQWLIKSDILNYTHCLVDLMTYSYVQKAALWCIYGKTEMASLFSQLLLNFNTTNFNLKNSSFTGEGKCLAICTLANSLMAKVFIFFF